MTDQPRTVLVTGGGKGIGRAIAEGFTAAGDRVVICGRDPTAFGDRSEAHVCDVTDEAAVATLFAAVGPVDVLVLNAGVATAAPLAKHTLDDWRHMLDVNATGCFLCTRAALPDMLQRDSGRIVTIASTAGLRGHRYTAGYTASKHAAVGLMRVAAAECAGTGVTANAVCPGFVRSEMTERTIANIVAKTGRTDEDALSDIVSQTRLGRLIEPAEVAAAVLYLASREAAAVNGQTLTLDGGGD